MYFELGLDHILHIDAIDHILFIVALCAIYRWTEWKKVAILVSAFTIGHSITLGLAALNIIVFPKDLIEKLIPLTIIISCIYNILSWDRLQQNNSNININYFFALFFGLIHGMGFSNILKSLLVPGQNLIKPLFSFNLGIEVGQLIIVFLILIVAFVVMDIFKIKQRNWAFLVSIIAGFWAIYLFIQQII